MVLFVCFSVLWGVLVFLSYRYHREESRDTWVFRQTLLLDAVAARYDVGLTHVMSDLRLMTRHVGALMQTQSIDYVVENVTRAFQTMVETNPSYSQIRLIRADGVPLVGVRRTESGPVLVRSDNTQGAGISEQDRYLMRDPKFDGMRVSPLVLRSGDDPSYVRHSSAVYSIGPGFSPDTPGEPTAYVMIDIDPTRLLESVQRNVLELVQLPLMDSEIGISVRESYLVGNSTDLLDAFPSLVSQIRSETRGSVVDEAGWPVLFRRLSIEDEESADENVVHGSGLYVLSRMNNSAERADWAAAHFQMAVLWGAIQVMLVLGGIFLLFQSRKKELLHHSIASERAFLTALLDALPIPVYFRDAAGNVIGFNAAFTRFWAGQSVGDAVSGLPQEANGFLDEQRDGDVSLVGGEHEHLSVSREIVDGSGSRRYLMVHRARYRSHDASIAGVIGLIVDLTETHNYELALQKAVGEAERASHAKSAFLAAMSHEIRTPMNGILGMASLLGETRLTDTQKEYVHTVSASGETLLNLINDILDFSKIQADRIELESKTFDLEQVVCGLLDLFARQAEDSGNVLSYRVEPGFKPAMQGDMTRVRQILNNLIANAVKFTSHGDVCVVMGPHPDDPGSVDVAIRDTGIGIKPERMADLFSPFMQEDSSTTRRYGGSGMGLVISKGLVDIMGGRLGVESQPGRGSIFTVTLPRGNPDPSVAEFVQNRLLMGLSAIVVDSHPSSLQAVSDFLRQWGMEVTPFSDPVKATSWVGNGNRADMILIDQDLPGKGGVKLGGDLFTLLEHQQVRTPLVLMVPSTEKAAPDPFFSYVPKPVHRKSLQKVLIDAASRQTSAMPRIVDGASSQRVLSDFAKSHPMEILVVEDNKVNQKVVDLMLRKLGYRPTFAADGDEGWRCYMDLRPEVVFMDIQMPVMDGIQSARKIRSLENGFACNIIGLSANVLEDTRNEAKSAGFNDYLFKPVNVPGLKKALEEAYSRVVAQREPTSVPD